MRKALLIVYLIPVLAGAAVFAQQTDEKIILEEMSKLDFIVGHWHSVSTFVGTGAEAHGDLSYIKVLGGSFILCMFAGEHPDGRVWEAYEMITFDPSTGKYRDFAFFSSGGPVTYTGEWTAGNTMTFTSDNGRSGGRKDRISYQRKADGSVFQLNEATDAQGAWLPTLETVYLPWKSGEKPILKVEGSETDPVVSAMGKLDFLLGRWRTVSTFAGTGQEAPGDLTYSKVLGGKWILCRFKGDSPSRPIWEAYAMITYELAAGDYRSFAFFGNIEPATYIGEWVDERTILFTSEGIARGGQKNRIFYTGLSDGTVHQVNEAQDREGNWLQTLDTVYRPWK